MTKVVNIKDKPTPHYDVYIGRANKWFGLEASKWANPYVLKKEEARGSTLERYEAYVRSRPDLMAALPELEGKVLGCYCKPKPCHGDILIKLLNEVVGDAKVVP